ncbi:tight adherence protein C [Vibrio xiamenensis]|uniref:Tight adherence protein C n=1 Tax=Vibrio xiamenensis TaxID=861298 RepID=A0A1G7W2L0_9VIBR|nr:type II secretion system F family protein [Vibrio xiamenensis]SDG66255.1 tight adherence protein C [Vibrio xiamenensis]
MDILLNWLDSLQLDGRMVFLGMILISSTLMLLAVVLLVFGRRSPLKVKLEQIKTSQEPAQIRKSKRLDHTLESLAPVMTPKNVKERESIRHQLMHAGYHDASALTTFYALKGCSLALGVAIGATVYFLNPSIEGKIPLLIVGAIAAGLFLPNILLRKIIAKRQSRIRGGVPDALDLLVVCTESGLGFSAALRRVADELTISHPDFADELDTVCAKIKAGIDMSDAFDDLIKRTGVVEIKGLVSMLAHASRIGGSLSQTLREYTEDFRDKRNQEVEEIAAKIPTKMIFPLLIFIWPCFFIVAIGPAMLSLSATLGK